MSEERINENIEALYKISKALKTAEKGELNDLYNQMDFLRDDLRKELNKEVE